jgi:hypothetical protein
VTFRPRVQAHGRADGDVVWVWFQHATQGDKRLHDLLNVDYSWSFASMIRPLKSVVCALLVFWIPAWASADVIVDWNNVLLDTVRSTPLNPPYATRAMAMMHTAMYDAVNSVAQTHQPYHVQLPADAGTSAGAAAAQAAHRVLTSLYPAKQGDYDAALSASLATIADGPGKTSGLDLGMNIADAILTLRANDHSGAVVSYTPGVDPGDWQSTPPANASALLPGWGQVTPWAMTSGSQFRQAGPPELNTTEYTNYFNEVKQMGAATNSTRSEDQSNIAQFWADNPGTSTPPGHWMRIAQSVSQDKGLTMEENARLFALLGISQADAAISCWDNKYAFNDWRPVTAIRNADSDGNPDTEPDTEWSSFIVTPPFPSYTSGHSTFSGAASTVLAEFFGTDNVSFTSSAEGFAVPDRSFTSFSQAGEEAMNSRLYGGIHWRYDNEDGLAAGQQIGHYVFDMLAPVPEPSSALLGWLALTGLLPVARGRRPRLAELP